MRLLHVVIQIGLLCESLVTVFTTVGLLARVLPHVNFQTTLLRKYLFAVLTRILWKVRVLVIDNQALLTCLNLFRTVGHPTAPTAILNREREVCGTHDTFVMKNRVGGASIFLHRPKHRVQGGTRLIPFRRSGVVFDFDFVIEMRFNRLYSGINLVL